jgi:four helix bundle suffix protein
MMVQWCSVTAFSTGVRAPMTRWCRQREVVSKTSPKAAWLPAHPRRLSRSWWGVARASLEELLLDYQDFLRQRGFALWGKDHPQAKQVRALCYQKNRSYQTHKPCLDLPAPPEPAANALICLIHQTNYLLDQQLWALEKEFLNEGGFTERLDHARQEVRKRNKDR